MKTILKLVLLLAISNQFATAQNAVNLRINHLLGDEPFALSQTAIDENEDEFMVTRLEYYISGINLIHDGGISTKIDETFLVNASESEDYDLGAVDFTNLEAIRFSIGVDPTNNHLDPSSFPADHPLYPQSPSMHWGWAAGYRFIAYEGVCNGNITFQFHSLGDDNYFYQTIAIENPTVENETTIIELDADYIKALSDIKLSLGPISHGETGEALTCIANFTNKVFEATVAEENPQTSNTILDLNDDIANIYPNPSSSNFVNIDLNTNENYELKVFDALGKLVKTQILNTQNNRVILEQSGIYFLHLQNEKGNIYTQKVSIL